MFDLHIPSGRRLRKLRRELLDKRFVVGEVLGADGTTPSTGRQGKTGETVVGQAHGKYYEPASRGRTAFACDQGAGVSTTTAISTTAILSLYNPINSGFRLSVLKVGLGYFSGTLGAGPVYHCVTPQVSGTAQTLPSSGTALTSYWTDQNILTKSAAPVGLARVSSTVVAPIVYRPFCSLFAELASTANGIQFCTEDMDGEIVIEPGGSYQMQSVCAAGSSPKVTVGIFWEEIPYTSPMG